MIKFSRYIELDLNKRFELRGVGETVILKDCQNKPESLYSEDQL
jgi:hypothetical protein